MPLAHRSVSMSLDDLASCLVPSAPRDLDDLREVPDAMTTLARLESERLDSESASILQAYSEHEHAIHAALPAGLQRRFIALLDALGARAGAERDVAYQVGIAVGQQWQRVTHAVRGGVR